VKVIYTASIQGEPYKITISDDVILDIISSQKKLKKNFSSWWLYSIGSMKADKICQAYIEVGKRKVRLFLSNNSCDPHDRESLLDFDDDLLTISSPYITKMFLFHLKDNIHLLNLDEVSLVMKLQAIEDKISLTT
jgi:hypothetical protein